MPCGYSQGLKVTKKMQKTRDEFDNSRLRKHLKTAKKWPN